MNRYPLEEEQSNINQNCLNYKELKFNIQGLSRLSQDSCYKNYESQMIQKPASHMTTNFHDCKCEAPNVLELSLQQR